MVKMRTKYLDQRKYKLQSTKGTDLRIKRAQETTKSVQAFVPNASPKECSLLFQLKFQKDAALYSI